jgi:hypothetical protein
LYLGDALSLKGRGRKNRGIDSRMVPEQFRIS